MSDSLSRKLTALHADNQPDPAFADTLEAQLRAAHGIPATAVPVRRWSFLRPLARAAATAAALIVIASALVLTVPPLRTLAQDILDFFVVGTMPPPPPGSSANDVPIQFDTLEKAEAIAGFDALAITDSRVTIAGILANTDYVTQFYSVEDVGMVVLSQWVEGAGIEYYPVSDASAVENVTVNGVAAQFIAGAWNYVDGEYVWLPDAVSQLHWERDGMVYQLGTPPKFAGTAEALIAIAEALE